MRSRRIIAGVATIAALAGGTAGAVAATSDDKKAAESAVLADAAKRLGVSAAELRSALGSAEDAQLDAAVKAGKLTQAQADAMKQRRQADGTVLGLGHGNGPHPPGGGFGHGGGGRELMADAAKAIGISESALHDQLEDGKTLSAIASAHGKTLAEVKAAVKQSATARLAADLKAKRITQAQYDDEVAELDDEIDRLASGAFRGHGPRDGDRVPAPTTP
jgi:hypothetical protein